MRCPRCESNFPLAVLHYEVRSVDLGSVSVDIPLCAACRLKMNDEILRAIDTKVRKFRRPENTNVIRPNGKR